MGSMKLLRSILIVAIAGVAISGSADTVSQEYAEQSLSRALVTFTAARALNGVISVAQGTEVAVEPGGVGVILTPGQILDPINDLIEQFSGIMLIAATSLGLQLILLEICSWWGVTAILVFSIAIWLISIWIPGLNDRKYVAAMVRLSILLTFVRFAIPMVIIGTNFIFDGFLLSRHDSATAELNKSSVLIEEVNNQFDEAASPGEVMPEANQRLPLEESKQQSSDLKSIQDYGSEFSRFMQEWYSGIKRSSESLYSGIVDLFNAVNVADKMEQLEASAENATKHIIELIVIFLLQTIIFPLIFLWILVEVLKNAASRTISAMGARKSDAPQIPESTSGAGN